MKLACLALTLLLPACTTVYMPNGEHYRTMQSAWSVVNNTGVQLDIFIGGSPLAKNVETGQVMPLCLGLFRQETTVTVVGHTSDGRYVGTANHRFFYDDTCVWTVTGLTSPPSR